MLLVSACLAGVNCRYDGKTKKDPEICRLVAEGKAIPVCPEQLGGLPTPRPPSEIVCAQGRDNPVGAETNGPGALVLAGQARVVNEKGCDVTDCFLRGARETLHLAQLVGATEAVLKEGSPSCGVNRVYDGTFTGKTIPGTGITTALLAQHNIKIRSEKG